MEQITEEQLQGLIEIVGVSNLEQAIKKHRNKLTYMNVFKTVAVKSDDIEQINKKHHVVTNPTGDFNRYRSTFSRKGRVDNVGFGMGEMLTHDSFNAIAPHDAIKTLVFSLMGEKNGKRLDEDELEFARNAYRRIKAMYLHLYDLRLTELE